MGLPYQFGCHCFSRLHVPTLHSALVCHKNESQGKCLPGFSVYCSAFNGFTAYVAILFPCLGFFVFVVLLLLLLSLYPVCRALRCLQLGDVNLTFITRTFMKSLPKTTFEFYHKKKLMCDQTPLPELAVK